MGWALLSRQEPVWSQDTRWGSVMPRKANHIPLGHTLPSPRSLGQSLLTYIKNRSRSQLNTSWSPSTETESCSLPMNSPPQLSQVPAPSLLPMLKAEEFGIGEVKWAVVIQQAFSGLVSSKSCPFFWEQQALKEMKKMRPNISLKDELLQPLRIRSLF